MSCLHETGITIIISVQNAFHTCIMCTIYQFYNVTFSQIGHSITISLSETGTCINSIICQSNRHHYLSVKQASSLISQWKSHCHHLFVKQLDSQQNRHFLKLSPHLHQKACSSFAICTYSTPCTQSYTNTHQQISMIRYNATQWSLR